LKYQVGILLGFGLLIIIHFSSFTLV